MKTNAAGSFSSTSGYKTKTVSDFGHAEGNNTVASYAAHSEGLDTEAIGRTSHSEGNKTKSYGNDSHAEGHSSQSKGQASHAEGQSTIASGKASHAEGNESQASGESAHAEGTRGSFYLQERVSTASELAAHSEGIGTLASGIGSHSEGFLSEASSEAAHSEGKSTIASKKAAHAEGYLTQADGIGAHTEGSGAISWKDSSQTEKVIVYNVASGEGAHAEGYITKASGKAAHAEGGGKLTKNGSYITGQTYNEATGSYSHVEGYCTKATGEGAHAEGSNLVASGKSAHAEGEGQYAYTYDRYGTGELRTKYFGQTRASGIGSHAEGGATIASGSYAHAEGSAGCERIVDDFIFDPTEASGEASHAEGIATKAAGTAQHVQGRYNIVDEQNIYAHIVGNGDCSWHSNAHTLDWDGNAWFAGDVETQHYGKLSNKTEVYSVVESNIIEALLSGYPLDEGRTITIRYPYYHDQITDKTYYKCIDIYGDYGEDGIDSSTTEDITLLTYSGTSDMYNTYTCYFELDGPSHTIYLRGKDVNLDNIDIEAFLPIQVVNNSSNIAILPSVDIYDHNNLVTSGAIANYVNSQKVDWSSLQGM